MFMPSVIDVTPTELDVLKALWKESPADAATICQEVYGDEDRGHYYAVLKFLESLEAKGYVRRDASNRRHKFVIEKTVDEFLVGLVKDFISVLGLDKKRARSALRHALN